MRHNRLSCEGLYFRFRGVLDLKTKVRGFEGLRVRGLEGEKKRRRLEG